jgi:hypothetical protein
MDYALKWYALILKKNVIWNEKGILHIVKCWKRPQNGQNKTGLWRDSTKKKQEATESLSYQAGLVMVRNTYPVQFFESFTKKAWDYASNRTNNSISIANILSFFFYSYYRIISSIKWKDLVYFNLTLLCSHYWSFSIAVRVF